MALPLSLIRLVVLGTVLLFSLIALGLAGDLTTTSMRAFNVYFPFAALAIATAVLCFLTLPAMIALEIMRPGGPTSMIILELSWLGFLSILWLATGANAAEFVSAGFWFDCNDTGRGENPANAAGCHEMSAVAAFGFLNWLILMGYTGLLLVLSLIAANRKHTGVWTSSVANAPFDQPAHTPSAPGGSYGGETTQVGGTGGVGGHLAAYDNTSGSVQAGTVHV